MTELTFQIEDSDERGNHRECQYYNLVRQGSETRRIIDDIAVVLCKLTRDDNWWIVYCHTDDNQFEDIGPFVDYEHALVEFLLRSQPFDRYY